MDDGSTDDTAEVARLHGDRWDALSGRCLRYTRQKNQGAPTARNRGAGVATGEFLVFHDSDDVLVEDRIERQVAAFQAVDADMCGASVKRVRGDFLDSQVSRVRKAPTSTVDPLVDLLSGRLSCMTPAWMFRREFFAKVGGYDPALVCAQDYDVALRAMALGPRLTFAPGAWTIVRDHSHVKIHDVRYTAGGYESVFRLHSRFCTWLAGQEPTERTAVCRRLEASALLRWAVNARSREFDAAAQRFVELAEGTDAGASWGRNALERFVYRCGGVRACALALKLSRIARGHLNRPSNKMG